MASRLGVPLAAQSRQPGRARIVRISRQDAVAVGDEHALAPGVVGDALDVDGVVQRQLLQVAAAVVLRAQLAAFPFHVLRKLQPRGAVERVVARRDPIREGLEELTLALGERLSRPRLPVDLERCDAPIASRGLLEHGQDRRVGDDPARFVQHIALEVHARHGRQAGLVVVAGELSQQVAIAHRHALGSGLSRRPRVAILQPLAQRDAAAGIISRPHAAGPLQTIVGLEDQRSLAVAPLDFGVHRVQHDAADARIEALDPPRTIGQIVADS